MQKVELPPFAELASLQFGLLNDDVARQKAVFEFENFRPERGAPPGIDTTSDPRLGSACPHILCSCCGMTADECPGHFGIKTLAVPVFSGVLLPVVAKILTCLCVSCGRLLIEISPAKEAKLRLMDYKRRIKDLSDMALRQRVCVTPSAEVLGFRQSGEGCGARQPITWYRQTSVLVRPVFDLSDFDGEVSKVPVISPWHIQAILNNVDDTVSDLLGFNSTHSHVRACMQQTQLAPPSIMRSVHQKQGDDDLSYRLKAIVKANERLQQVLTPSSHSVCSSDKSSESKPNAVDETPADHAEMELAVSTARDFRLNLSTFVTDCTEYKPGKHGETQDAATVLLSDLTPLVVVGEGPDSISLPTCTSALVHTKNKKQVVPPFLNEYFELQRNVAGFQDKRNMPKLDHDYGRERKDIRVRFNAGGSSKFCNVRYNLLGKRSDSSGRAVASPGSDLQPDEVGVPQRMCEILTQPVVVSRLNFKNIFKLVRNGPDVYPGANYVQRGATMFTLPNFTEGGLKLGDVVHRHLHNGDLVLINRQPTLHRGSMLGYKVVVHTGFTLRISLAMTEAMNLDFDGDEINLYTVQDFDSMAEARELMSVSQNIIRDGDIMVGPVQHTCLAFYFWSQPDCTMPVATVQQLLVSTGDTKYTDGVLENLKTWRHSEHRQSEFDEEVPISGRMFLQAIVPGYLPEQHGVLTKKVVRKLLSVCYKVGLWTCEEYIRHLGYIMKMGDGYLLVKGVSMSIRDCSAPHLLLQNDPEYLHWYKSATVLELELRQLQHRNRSSEVSVRRASHLESQITKVLDRARELVGHKHVNFLKSIGSDLFHIIASGSKGDTVHMVQNSGLVGQQLNADSKRSYYEWVHELDTRPLEAKGFVQEAFVDGLKAVSFFLHLCSSRVGLVGTAVSTAEAGYLSRKTAKALEDLRASFDNSVRRAMGRIVMLEYGFATQFLAPANFDCTYQTAQEIQSLYGTVVEPDWKVPQDGITLLAEVAHLIKIRDTIIQFRIVHSKVLSPMDFPSSIKRAILNCNRPNGVSVTGFQIRATVRKLWSDLISDYSVPGGPELQACFFENLSTYRLRQAGLQTDVQLLRVVETVLAGLSCQVVQPDSPVGIEAAQSMVAPLTQMQLDSPHHCGQSCELLGGIKRTTEILNFTKNIKTPSMTLVLKPGYSSSDLSLTEVRLSDCFSGWMVSSSPNQRIQHFSAVHGFQDDDASWLVLRLRKDILQENKISPRRLAELVLRELESVEICDSTTLEKPETLSPNLDSTGQNFAADARTQVTDSVDDEEDKEAEGDVDKNNETDDSDGDDCDSRHCEQSPRASQLNLQSLRKPSGSGNTNFGHSDSEDAVDCDSDADAPGCRVKTSTLPQTDRSRQKDNINRATETDAASEPSPRQLPELVCRPQRQTDGSTATVDNVYGELEGQQPQVDTEPAEKFVAKPHDSQVLDRIDHRAIGFANLWDDQWWVSVRLGHYNQMDNTNVNRVRTIAHTVTKSKRQVSGVQKVKGYYTVERDFFQIHAGVVQKVQRTTVVTLGSNWFEAMSMPCFDPELSTTNDLHETYANLGIDALRRSIQEQLLQAMAKDSITPSSQHAKLVAHAMCSTGQPCALSFSGMTNSNSSNLKLATFERILESFIGSGVSGEFDSLQGTSESVMVGAKIPLGTGGAVTLIPSDTVVVAARFPIRHVRNLDVDVELKMQDIECTSLKDRTVSNVHERLIAFQKNILEPPVTTGKLKRRFASKPILLQQSHKKARSETAVFEPPFQTRTIVAKSSDIFYPSSPTS
jgi:DNA-directed RNA polymerase beta' subunit